MLLWQATCLACPKDRDDLVISLTSEAEVAEVNCKNYCHAVKLIIERARGLLASKAKGDES